MASIFYDSFNGYNNLALKWSSGENGTFSTADPTPRTGTQSLASTWAGGFSGLPRINFASRDTVIAGCACYFSALNVLIFTFFNSSEGVGYGSLTANGDGSITVESDGFVGQTAPGVLSAGVYEYIEMMATFVAGAGGSLILRVNGAVVLNIAGGVIPNGFAPGVDGFLLQGSNINFVYFNDLYILDSTGPVNNTFLGAVRIYAILPDLDETPLQWTPLTGTNVSQVNQEPPPGDAAYVFSNTIGQIDQYHYPITGLPGTGYKILAVQHSLCARLDAAGSHTIASQINGTTGAAPQVGTDAPGTDYEYVITPWDINPNTAEQFQPSDFATTFLGPILTG